MTSQHFLAACLLLAILFSCNKAIEEKSANSDEQVPAVTQADGKQQPIPVSTNQPDSVASVLNTQPVADPDWDKKIIKTGTLQLEVTDFKKTNDKVHNSIRQLGGYIASEEQTVNEERSQSEMTIKVPVSQFETLMNELSSAEGKLLVRKIETDDVTSETIDTKSRLEAKKEVREKYLAFLKQSKNMQEVLQAQAEVNAVQEQIESAAGRVNYLSHQARYSSIRLTYFQPAVDYTPENTDPGFFSRLARSFSTGAGWFADLLIGLASIWPMVTIIVISIILWKRSRVPKMMEGKS